jgi:hypothetical protein
MPYGPAAAKQRRLQHEAEAHDVLTWWTRGYAFDDVAELLADKYGKPFSVRTVVRRFHLARECIVLPETEQAVREHRQKLNYLWSCIQPGLAKGSAASVKEAVAILDRESKLLGLDRPVKAEIAVEVTVTGSIEAELASLAAELNMREFAVLDAEVVEDGPSVGRT